MYDELVRRLRICPDYNDGCVNCQHEHDLGCRTTTMREAADAIENLVRKEKFHAFLWNTIQPNEMEQYLAMYRAQAVPQEPPKEET